MLTIDKIAKEKSKQAFNLSFMGNRYKTDNGLFTFPSPSLSVIEANLFLLYRYSRQEALKPKYRYRPSYLSFDEYGTDILDYLLMYVNGISCSEEFTPENVIIPTFNIILQICQETIGKKDVSKLEAISW